MSKAYVSDFEIFMAQFIKDHPEEVVKQKAGWESFWNVKVDPASQVIRKEDIVPDDHYGFIATRR